MTDGGVVGRGRGRLRRLLARVHPLLSPTGWRSLRGRAALSFAGLTLVLAAVMALGVWFTVSQFLVLQRERSATAQAVANAEQVQLGLQTAGASQPEVLSQLRREIGSTSLAVTDGRWFTTSLKVGRDDLPAELRRTVVDGQAARQRLAVDGGTVLVVGVPLSEGAAYFEVFPLGELRHTLRLLAAVLLAAVTVVPLLALVLGWWVTRPTLRPLSRISEAAAAIAQGEVGTRIDPRGDPELVPIAASFNTTAAALERRVRADARFAADVAHELRSPLTTMLSAASLADQYRDRLPHGGQEALRLLKEEVERFSRLVQDLLEISRVDAGDADVTLATVRVADLVRRVLPLSCRHRLVVEPEALDLCVRTDKRRLERVVANLVQNAEAHGGGVVAVTVDRADGSARVIVDDAGPGVPHAERQRIFERFARGPASARDTTDGAGLGLALVARHVHALGGEVEVHDSPPGGARFVVTLPLEAAP